MKYCLDCKLLKQISEFSKNKRKKDGCDIYCKSCISVRGSKHYKQNKDKAQTRHKEWVSNNRGKMAEYCKSWRERNPEQNKQIHHDNYMNNREAKAAFR
jgi:hypothetical protein